MDINIIETYKPHPLYPQYAISSFGNVYSTHQKKNLKLQYDKDGYRYVFISIDGKNKRKQVHRLMAETFIPNPENKPLVLFRTKRKDCAKVKDLFWGDPVRRTENAYERGFFPSKRNTIRKVRKPVTDEIIHQIIDLLLQGDSYKTISLKLDVSPTVVYKVRNNKYHIKFPEQLRYFVF